MRSRTFVFSAMSTLALAAGFVLVAPTAPAQQGDSAKQLSKAAQEEVTVVGPRIIRTRAYGGPHRGVSGYDLLTLTHRVSYADLDLSRSEDAKTLENRINTAANQICEDLAKTPPQEAKSRDCVQMAVRGAMEQANAAIAAAKK